MVNKKLIGLVVIFVLLASISVVAFTIGDLPTPVNPLIENLPKAPSSIFLLQPLPCVNIQKLVLPDNNNEIQEHRDKRKQVCESASLGDLKCIFTKGNTPEEDTCTSDPGQCPEVRLYNHGLDDGRKKACESTRVKGVNCLFEDGSSPENSKSDRCNLDIDGDGLDNKEDQCDNTPADVTVQDVGPKAGCPLGDFNGDGFVNKDDVKDIRNKPNRFWEHFVLKDSKRLHEFVKALVLSINQ